MNKNNTFPKLILYPKSWLRITALTVAILQPLFYITFFHENTKDVWLILFAIALCMLVSLYSFVFTFKTYLLIDENGLTVKGLFANKVRWNELSEFASKYIFRIGLSLWGIYYTIKSADGKAKRGFLVLGHVVERPPHKKVDMLVMPSGYDLAVFKQTEFGQILWENAPQLFEEEKHKNR